METLVEHVPVNSNLKRKTKEILPKIIKSLSQHKTIDNFPLEHYSYSTFVKFSTNPILFKIQYINGDRIETTRNISSVIGQAFHKAMEAYYSYFSDGLMDDERIKDGLEQGLGFISEYNDGFIEYSSVVPNKQKAQDIFTFAYNAYIQSKAQEGEVIGCEMMIDTAINVEWRGARLNLPVKLKGYIDKLVRVDGKLKIIDYKTTRAFSDPEKIDGSKIIQAVQYFLMVYAETGEAPYSMIFEEVKTTKNRDGSSQIKEYEMVYSENDQFFDFYFRLYEDMTRAINGEMVYVPNILSFFDNEIAIVSYINRLDVSEEVSNLLKEMQVSNITELLKKQIHNAGNMRKFLKTAEKKFMSAKNLNYEAMNIEERIQTKLMEHGMMVKFEKKIEGYSIDLYEFNPSIGLKMSRLMSYVADIEQVVGKSGVRVLAPIPNTSLIGFEIPRDERRFPEVLPPKYPDNAFNLAIGVDVMGDIRWFDIRKAPHMLVAGATGSGKSVFLNSIISQLINNDNVELHLFDPKIVELARFRNRAAEYYTDPVDIYLALSELVSEMNARYSKLSKRGVRNIEEYGEGMRYKFVVVDEFGDLTIGNHVLEEEVRTGEIFTRGAKAGEEKIKIEKTEISKEISRFILILAQKARAAGIHLIVATQRPSVDIITGSIKANFSTKAVFRVAKAVDSQVVLDQNGAEKLLGKGDFIFSTEEGEYRLQGFNV